MKPVDFPGVQPLPLPRANSAATKAKAGANFAETLEKVQNQDLKFSLHALNRIDQRQISLDERRLELLERAVAQAKEKGARDSLILIEDLALVVSVTNSTVVTVLEGARLKDNVFTNIDSAVVVKSGSDLTGDPGAAD